MPGPKLFVADERGLGGRQMLQQQHIHMQNNLKSAKPSLHTGKSRKDMTIEKMIGKGTQRMAYLRSVPYSRKVPRVVDYGRYMGKNIDNDPPQNFNALWCLPINQGLREKSKMGKKSSKKKARAEPFALTDELGVVPDLYGTGRAVGESLRWGEGRKDELSELYAAVRQRRDQRIAAGVAYVDDEEATRTARLDADLRTTALEALSKMTPVATARCGTTSTPQRPSTAPPSRGRPVPPVQIHTGRAAPAADTPTFTPSPPSPRPLSPAACPSSPAKQLWKGSHVPTPATPDTGGVWQGDPHPPRGPKDAVTDA
eukprot:TRINITY_DN9686_c0_g1_i1.p2 TRINITY_DN9686_c0_g1~~TRINITY_DN9686_c0_g1_i1.p2  ORF type:complete len:313 (+),score=82.00 TRINITY_DN9686_c0_g1_i1:70-1008(+)